MRPYVHEILTPINGWQVKLFKDFTAVMMSIDLRLGHSFPAALIPLEAYPSLIAGLACLIISIFTLTSKSQKRWLPLRLILAPISCHFFWDFGYAPYKTTSNQVAVGLAVVGLYGIMRVVETTFVDFIDLNPVSPRWVTGGRLMPLPETMTRRS